MSNDTSQSQLIINVLSQQQYEAISNPSDTELYFIPDTANRIVLTPDQNSYTLTTNNYYEMSVSSSVSSLSITLNTPTDTTTNNVILVHAFIGNVNMTINFGTTHYFDDETLSLTSLTNYYDILYIYNPLKAAWICRIFEVK